MTQIDAVDLASVELFANLDEEGRAIVANWLETIEVPVGWELTHQGQAGYVFYVLREGTAEVRVDGATVRVLSPGDYFGELSMLGDGTQTATVVVTSPSIVWSMFGTRFRELQRDHPDIAAVIERTAAERQAG
ncbi:MAG TPA: cyclic nucleotide-binding domain-containing protein [Mycobacteriales bacterium]|nr:cyclic nucleotide-binding domain-containing protein [Mycobacteriales bacterium]